MTDKNGFYRDLRCKLGLPEKQPENLIFEEIKEIDSNSVKLRVFLDRIIEGANRELSYYRQRKEDLIARMATDWPNWGCGLDFYSFFVLPFIRNSLILHFINSSEEITLENMKVASGFITKTDGNGLKVEWVREQLEFNSEKRLADLVDLAILPIKEFGGPNTKLTLENIQSHLVRIRDADIGVQAFFTLLEGLIRNAAKHGAKEGDFEIKIVFAEDSNKANRFLGLENNDERISDDNCEYCYVLISVSRDTNIEKIENIKKGFKEKIVSENDGSLTPGNWGLKEIRICSTFVGGGTLKDINPDREGKNVSVEKFIRVGITNKLWNDGKRLYYLIRLQKPKHVLAVLNEGIEETKAREWYREKGVRVLSTEAFKTTLNGESEDRDVDYDFLYIHEDIENDLAEEIKRYDLILPRRRVIGQIIMDDNQKDEFILGVYDSYLSEMPAFKRYENSCNFIVYFDDEKISSKWGCLRGFEFPKAKEDLNKSLFPDQTNKYQFAIARHQTIADIGLNSFESRLSNSYKTAYYQYVSYSDQFFSFLMSIDPSRDRLLSELVLRQIKEAALMNVLIVDERIAQTVSHLNAPDEPTDKNISFAEKLYWMGIYVAKSITLDGSQIWSLVVDDPQKVHRMVDVNIINDRGILCQDDVSFDIILIHATRLKEICDKCYISGEKAVDNLKKTVPNVIVHSGRGYTRGDIPNNVSFLEYSIVQRYTVQEPSKFYLVQIGMNAKGSKHGE